MKKYRIPALIMCLCLLLSLFPFGALAAETDVIHISATSQLRDLADDCRLDSWSVGKTVVLDCDIDLGGEEFEPIPSFGGTFDGNGHSISGLYVKGKGSAVGGLFRYVQSGALIKDLNVEGVIEPEMNAECFGAVAGSNSGTIENCSVSGAVSGSADIGGIVGVNNSDGLITDSRSLAAVSGEHYTGGIAGRNLGSIIRCTNLGPVNTSNPEMESDSLDIDWENFNSTENVAAHTDTGGITGFSQGTLEQCVNRGNVGYPHVGYNVGGVAGRQVGFVDACRNFGIVNGRKDVGGVIGQMAPDIRMHFSGSGMEQIQAEMEVLQTLLDDLIADVQGSSNEINGILTQAGAYLDSAGQSAGAIIDSVSDFIDGNIEVINDIAALVQNYITKFGGVISEVENCIACLSEAMDGVNDFLDKPENKELYPRIYESLSGVAEDMEVALAHLTVAIESLENAVDTLYGILSSVGSGTTDRDKLEESFDSFLTESGKAAQEAEEALKLLTGAIGKMNTAGEIIRQLMENGDIPEALADSVENFTEATEHLDAAISLLETLIRELGREEVAPFEGLDGDFAAETDRMSAALAGLGEQMDKLNTAMNGSVNVLGTDLRLVNDQFFKVMECFMELLEGSTSSVEVYEDMSEEELFSATDGKVQSSENHGKVDGDVNTGGIVGAIGIEYDLDPEEDISVSGSNQGTFRYFTNAVLLDSVNFEGVTGKKDCVGGAVGFMDLGVVYGCENYGDVTSTSGDYVGGIAGQSAAAVRNCWSLCALSGRDYVGGIAGSVMDVSGCRSIVKINSTGGFAGAIAGELGGEASENYFVGKDMGGIDGVNYAGKAEEQSYSEFVAAEGTPGEFEDFKLTFVTDTMLVKSVSFRYGKAIDATEIPKVPERIGYVGQWESFDFNNLTFSATVKAVYTPYDTVVAVEDTVGKRSVLLLEGSFLPGTVPQLAPCENPPSGALEAWTVSTVGLVEDAYALRYLAPADGEDLKIYLLRDGRWQSVDFVSEGSYLIFEGSGESCSFAAVKIERPIPTIPLILVGAIGAALIVFVLVLRARVSRKAKASKRGVKE